MVVTELLDQQVHKDFKGFQDFKDPKVPQDLLVSKEVRVSKDQQGSQVSKDQQVSPAPLERRDNKVFHFLLVLVDPRDQMVVQLHKDPRGQLDFQELQDQPEILLQLEPPEPLALKGAEDRQEDLVLTGFQE